MRKTTMQNGPDALDSSATSASSALETLTSTVQEVNTAFQQMKGGQAGQAAGPNVSGQFSTAQANASASVQSSASTANPATGGGVTGGVQAGAGWQGPSTAWQNPAAPAGSPGFMGIPPSMTGGQWGVVPPTATNVALPAMGFSPSTQAGSGGSGGGGSLPPRNAQGQFVSPNGSNSNNSSGTGSGFNAAQYSPFAPGQYGGQMVRNGVSVAANIAAGAMDYGTQQIATGRANVVDAARLTGTALGGIIGAPFGMSGPGAAVLGAYGAYLAQPYQNKINAIDAVSRLHQTVGTVKDGGLDPFTNQLRGVRSEEIRRRVSFNGPDAFGVSVADVATGYASTAAGMLSGGRDPYAAAGTGDYGPSRAEIQRHFDDQKAGRTGTRSQASAAIDYIRSLAGGPEEAAEAVTRRAYKRYRNRGTEVLQSAGQIYSDMPDVGDNTVDRIGKYGSLRAMEFGRLQNDDGKLPMPEEEYISFSKDLRDNKRKMRRESLQTRGAAQSVAKSLQSQLSRIDSTADGKDSMLHQETAAELREAGRAAFDEKSITSYALPMTKLEGQLARADTMPFSPSNVMSLSLQHIKLNEQRVGQLSSYMSQRKKSGQLSEREELELTQQIEQAKTSTAQDQARLGENFEQKLPAMLSGGNMFSSRFTTPMLAAMALQGSGNNAVRFLGAANGQHLQAQDDFYAGDKGNTSLMAHSRTQAFNSVPYQTRGGAAGQRAAAASSPAAAAASNAPGPSGRTAASQDAGEPVRASAGASSDSGASAPSPSPNRRWSREDTDNYSGAPDEKSSSKAWVGQHGGQVDTDKDGRVQTYNRDGARVYGRDVQGDPLAALKASTGYVPPKPNTYLAPKGRIGAAGNADGPQGDFGGWDKQPVQKMTSGDTAASATGANSRMDDGGASASGPGGSGGGAGETNDLLRQIRDLLSQLGGKRGGGRADEALSSLSDMMGRTTGNNGGGFTPKFN